MQCEKKGPQIIAARSSCLIYPSAILSGTVANQTLRKAGKRASWGPKTIQASSKMLQNGGSTLESGSIADADDMFSAESQQCNIAAFTLLIFQKKASKWSLLDLMEQLTLRTCTQEH